jgi:uncharacterized OsmC-like protein
MSTLNFSINGKSINTTLYQGQSRQFTLNVDEPETLGGKDISANPVEYLLAGYAGCLNVVFNLVAKEKNINIKELKINIDGDINPGKFLGFSEIERAGFLSLNVHIQVDTDSSDLEVDDLIETVKKRCPINDNLTNPTPVNYFLTRKLDLN